MIEDASARAAEKAIDRFIANRQREHPPPPIILTEVEAPPPPPPPEDNESRENGPQDMSFKEERGSQASPPIALPQRRRGDGEHADRMGRREDEAITSRRENVSQTRNDSQRQGVTYDPLPLAVAPARKSPFSMQILAEALLQEIRIPSLAEYNGTGDPEDHLEKFLAKADLLDMSDAGYCKIFRATLSGKAMAWFNQLLIHTIENFEQLSQHFLHHFSINKRYPKTASYLFTIIQQEQESLRDYVQRFSEAVLEVPHLNHELLASILQQGLRRGRFRESIAGKPPSTWTSCLKEPLSTYA
ncbi:UNVERIFIED_CONTAM: hypothetical protein Slati_2994900 [Sesamum latifolium]|uniref:Retrotransposon gag domain-containing protein n=1 Tax=Sesamum latifolium TaxID=2727402 RepID=A0AAW2VKC5_9LAMI